MPGITRQNIHRGPGAAVFGTVLLHDRDGITADLEQSAEPLSASVSGQLDTILTDLQGRIRFAPAGELSADILAALFPHQSPVFGSSLFGATDVPLEIFGVDGKTLKFYCTALTGIPTLRLSATLTAFGEAEFTALPANGVLAGEEGHFYLAGTEEYAKGFAALAGVTGHAYAVSWGGVDITDLTGDGATVEFDLGTQDVTTDRGGTIDKLLTSLAVRAAFTPQGVSASDLLAMRSVSSKRGTSLAGGDLVIASATGLTVTLKNAALVSGPCQWGASALRVGQLGFTAHRAANGQLYTITLPTPEEPDGGEGGEGGGET